MRLDSLRTQLFDLNPNCRRAPICTRAAIILDSEPRKMEEKDKVAIILEEYRSLRTEVLQRNTVLNSILTVAGTVSAATVGIMVQYSAYVAVSITILVVLLLVAYAFWIIDYDSRRIGFRLRQIETEVNHRANDNLLRWETEHGLNPEGINSRADLLMVLLQRLFNRAPLSKDK